MRELIERSPRRAGIEGRDLEVGTMIELPRACVIADRIAARRGLLLVRHQRPHPDRARVLAATTSRRGSCRPLHRRARSSTARRSRRSTSAGVGAARRAWPPSAAGREPIRTRARRLRRARRRPGLDRVLPQGRARLRLLLAVPRADRARRGRAGDDHGTEGRQRATQLLATARRSAERTVAPFVVNGPRHGVALGVCG